MHKKSLLRNSVIELKTGILVILMCCYAAAAQAVPDWRWMSNFSAEETIGLKAWILHAEKGMTSLFGPLPYHYVVYFHRQIDPEDPVPWAHTWKREGRDIHFHVDTSHSWKDFNEDWTAPHELTHLMFPYLDDDGAWFSEGIASYLQYQVMYANHTIDWDEVMAQYKDRYQAALAQGHDDLSIVELSPIAGKYNLYVRMYWGGAAYFMQADKRLYEEKHMRLNDVITKYINCCYEGPDSSVSEMMNTFDRLSDSNIFTETYQNTVVKKSFPETKAALAWLSEHPPKISH